MATYTQMARWYDEIMLSGYYDYDQIVHELKPFLAVASALEVGSGTGLILERIARQHPDLDLTGIDLTPAMLEFSADRLAAHPHVRTLLQDVTTMSLDRRFDTAFSYGGTWYFVRDDDGGHVAMVSHIRDPQANVDSFERVRDHLPPGGTLLLGIQGPHRDYEAPIRNDMLYTQRIRPIDDGFHKSYTLAGPEGVVMEQEIDYREYAFTDALALLDRCGFDYAGTPTDLFHRFHRR
jgi:SAM-dependent methyltransferase